MYCNRCGSQLDPNSSFCTTCGNAVNTTVVPQTDNTVVPTNGTVVPTVVPQNNKSNVTITSIIIVLVLFIGAGIVGILLLKNTKASTPVNNDNTQIAMDNITSAVTSSSTTKKSNSWATSSQRVDTIDNVVSYTVNGLKIYIPEGYTPSYTNNILTVVNNNGINYYMINVVTAPYDSVDQETFKNNLLSSGYTIKSFTPGTYMDRSGIKIDVSIQGYDYTCYVLKVNASKVALFLFDKGTTEEQATVLVNYSLM